MGRFLKIAICCGLMCLSSDALGQKFVTDPDVTEVLDSLKKPTLNRGLGLRQANSLGGGPAAIPAEKEFRVFILMGQSNMTGHGHAVDLKPRYKQKHESIRIWANNRWEYMVPHRHFGPEVSFARDMAVALPDVTIGIIKIAVGGTAIAAWKPDYDRALAAVTGDAMKGSLYGDMIQAVMSARKVSSFKISGFIWKQGGKDSRKAKLAESYQQNFVELVGRMRSDLAEPELPVFVLTYFDRAGIEAHRKEIARVRANALPIFMAQATVSDYLENAYPVFHGRLPTWIDGVHFNTKGQMRLGEMTARVVLEKLYPPEIEPEGTEKDLPKSPANE